LGWWDAADLDTITETSGLVSQWDDKSGDNRHLYQADGAYQPESGLTSFNNLNVINSYGSEWMSVDNASRFNDFQYRVFVVAKDSKTYQAWGICGNMDLFGNTGGWSLQYYDGGIQWNKYNIAGLNSRTCDAAKTDKFTLSHSYLKLDGSLKSNITVFDNGTRRFTEVTPSNVYDSSASYFSLFCLGYEADLATARFKLDGSIAEVIIAPNTMGYEDYRKIEGYLAWKWGIEADLDTGHQYRYAPPLL